MKNLQTTLMILSLLLVVGCHKQRQISRMKMMLDSEVSGKNVTVVRAKEAVRPAETVTDLKELPNIMQYDIEAAERTPSKEVVYVKRGEPIRPSEKEQ